MITILKQNKQLLITVILLLFITPVVAQIKQKSTKPVKHINTSPRLKDFLHLTNEADLNFVYPAGFKEVKAPNNEDFSFDYGVELPDDDFEVWYRVRSEKQDWISYQKSLSNPDRQLANPDSVYRDMADAEALALTGEKDYTVRTMPPNVLSRYNADAGKSYLLTLPDLSATKHYKYALLLILQKNHTGTVMAVCFTNEKGPEFFKEIERACHSLKFKS